MKRSALPALVAALVLVPAAGATDEPKPEHRKANGDSASLPETSTARPDRERPKEHHGRAFPLRGAIATLSDKAVGVRGERRSSLRCLLPPRMRTHVLATFQVGQRVQVLCLRALNRVVLFKIRPLETRSHRDENGELKQQGLVSALSEEAIVVRGSDGRLSCDLPPARAEDVLNEYMVGDAVAIVCRLREGRRVLERIELLEEPAEEALGGDEEEEEKLENRKEEPKKPEPKREVRAHGTVVALSPASISVRGEEAVLTCSVPDSAAGKAASVRLGDRVKIVCAGRESFELVHVERR